MHVFGTHCYLAGGLIHHNSGKSHDRALACVVGLSTGKRIVGLREVQKSIEHSVKQLIEDKINQLGLAEEFEITKTEVRHPRSGGFMIFRGLRDYSADSIKSLEGFDIAWVEEAHTITARSWTILTPTIRKPGSEIWCTWNPEFDTDTVDKFFRQGPPRDDVLVVQANYWDNQFFPDDLRGDMEHDRIAYPVKYQHVWCGGYRQISEGAYYAKQLAEVYARGGVMRLLPERNYPIYTGWDIGVDDETAIWAAQPVGRELRLLEYTQDNGQDAAYWARWVIDRGYDTGYALLPHDAGHREKGTLKTYEDHLREAGLQRTLVVPVTRSIMTDIQEVRATLARCVFDADGCREGLKVLGAYHVEWDDKAQSPKLKPEHNWASHGSDAKRTLVKGLLYVGGAAKAGVALSRRDADAGIPKKQRRRSWKVA